MQVLANCGRGQGGICKVLALHTGIVCDVVFGVHGLLVLELTVARSLRCMQCMRSNGILQSIITLLE